MECAILVGLPASGKTTFYRTHLAATHRHVSKDNFPNARDRNARQMRLIEEAFDAGASVAVDNTNPTPEVRAPIIAQARRRGASVAGYYFDANPGACIRRNQGRLGRARVPDVAIYAAARRLVAPSHSEGFGRLFIVSITGENGFRVEPWEH